MPVHCSLSQIARSGKEEEKKKKQSRRKRQKGKESIKRGISALCAAFTREPGRSPSDGGLWSPFTLLLGCWPRGAPSSPPGLSNCPQVKRPGRCDLPWPLCCSAVTAGEQPVHIPAGGERMGRLPLGPVPAFLK